MSLLLSGGVAPEQKGAFLMLLRVREETEAELAGRDLGRNLFVAANDGGIVGNFRPQCLSPILTHLLNQYGCMRGGRAKYRARHSTLAFPFWIGQIHDGRRPIVFVQQFRIDDQHSSSGGKSGPLAFGRVKRLWESVQFRRSIDLQQTSLLQP